MKTQFSEAQLAEISALQEKHNITRKSAIRRFVTSGKKISLTAGSKVKSEPVAPEADFKSRAANDDSNLPAASPEHAKVALNQAESLTPEARAAYEKQAGTATTPEAPKTPTPSTPAGDARKEGIRLFQLAGKPKKEDFIHVYGTQGAKWTWPARAKAVGLTSGEEAAKQFQAMRAKPAGSCVVVKEEPKEEPKAQK